MKEIITVVGNLGADPEQRTSATGIPYASFSVGSTAQRFVKERGEWEDDGTSWYRVAAYRQLGEHAMASFRKGNRVIVAGRLRVRVRENGGGKHVAVEVAADALGHDLLFGSSTFSPDRRHTGALPPDSREESAPAESDAWVVPGAPDSLDETIPF